MISAKPSTLRLRKYSPNELEDVEARTDVPLIVDLDGTISRRDIFLSLVLGLLMRKPWLAPKIIWLALSRGIASVKESIASTQTFDWETFPQNEALVDFLKQEHLKGRQIFLCSGAAEAHVRHVFKSLGFFSGFSSSNGRTNLVGETKSEHLENIFGQKNFDYIGDSRKDLSLVEAARSLVILNPSNVPLLESIFQQLRVKHWLKNSLVFLPLVAAHQVNSASKWFDLVMLFICLCLVASGTYILNDIMDLDADSRHPVKKFRPLVRGNLSLRSGLALSLTLMATSFGLLSFAGMWSTTVLLVGYTALTTLYSLAFKKIAFIDTTFLAGLFVFRLIMGVVAGSLAFSYWMLAFSFFFFYSLATVKRFTEARNTEDLEKLPGRSYIGSDAPILAQLGVSAGLVACAIFALYANSEAIQFLYPSHHLLLLCVPALTFWFSHLWLSAGKGLVHSDPIEWALRDRMSLSVAIFFGATLFTASMNFSWNL